MADEKTKEVGNGQMQGKGEGKRKEEMNQPETPQGNAKVTTKKSESEFLQGLTRTDATVSINDSGSFSVDGAFPQLNRKPLSDKTASGLSRISY